MLLAHQHVIKQNLVGLLRLFMDCRLHENSHRTDRSKVLTMPSLRSKSSQTREYYSRLELKKTEWSQGGNKMRKPKDRKDLSKLMLIMSHLLANTDCV